MKLYRAWLAKELREIFGCDAHGNVVNPAGLAARVRNLLAAIRGL